MAAVTYATGAGSTTNAATYTTASITPAASDLLVAYFAISGSTATDWTVTDSLGGVWTKVRREVKAVSADFMECWVRNALTASTTAMTLTISHASGNASGCAYQILRISGMSRAGSTAIKQTEGITNGANAATATHTFASAVLTGNPTVLALNISVNGPTNTAPTNWTATTASGIGYATPSNGARIATRDSGFTGTSVSWPTTMGGTWCSIGVEFDTSAPSVPAKSTSVERASLGSLTTPPSRTDHRLGINARSPDTDGDEVIRMQLYEGATARSAVVSTTVLTTAFRDYEVAITDAEAAAITDYSNLEIRFWGYAPDGDAATFEVSVLSSNIPDVWMTIPASVADTTPPTVSVGTGASGGKISGVTGKNDFPYSFTVNEACQAWQVRIVPNSGSAVTAGTLVESGGAVASGGTVSGSITYAEAVAASAAEGTNVVKCFAQDLAGNWNAV